MIAAVALWNQDRADYLNCVRAWQQGTNGQATIAHVHQIWGRGDKHFQFEIHVCAGLT